MERHYYSKDHFELLKSALKLIRVFVLCLIFTSSSAAAAYSINTHITASEAYKSLTNSKNSIVDTTLKTTTGCRVNIPNESIHNISNNITTVHISNDITTGERLEGIGVSPDGKEVYVFTFGDNIFIIDTKTNKVIATVTHTIHFENSVPDLVEKKLYVTSYKTGTVSEIDIANNTSTIINYVKTPVGVALSLDGKKLYVATFDGNVTVIDTISNKVTDTVKVREEITGITVSPDGKKIYVANWGLDTMNILDIIDTTSYNVAAVRLEAMTVNQEGTLDVVVVSPYGEKKYMLNLTSDTISIIKRNPLVDVADEISDLNLIQNVEKAEILAPQQSNADPVKVLKIMQ
jgi:YVTN family beta-propeller protein